MQRTMAKLKFDVMLKDKFIATMACDYIPFVPLKDTEIRAFVEKERPDLKGKKFHIAFYTKDNKTQQPKNFLTAKLK